jgi:hypothetical protein
VACNQSASNVLGAANQVSAHRNSSIVEQRNADINIIGQSIVGDGQPWLSLRITPSSGKLSI